MRDNTRVPITPAIIEYFSDNLPGKVGLWLFGTPSILFNNVASLNEIYVTKNAYHTKHENERLFGEPLLFNNIVSMDTADPKYKAKRKSLSAAFLKAKIRSMMGMVKSTTLRFFKDIQDKAVDGVTVADLNDTTCALQAHIITCILLGEGESFVEIDYHNKDGSVKKVTIAEHIDSTLNSFFARLNDNIFALIYPSLLKYQITATDRAFFKNCHILRAHIKQVI